jgi:adenine-specific DNA-methyltransferase
MALHSESFIFSWPGKEQAIAAVATPSLCNLISEQGKPLKQLPPNHVFIEGDNTEALKRLQDHLHAKVKMIYIDPPYNTGNNSFAYSDNYRKRTTKDNTVNAHAAWLSMMYTKLLLAKELLTNDGIIFISIDDNEVAHLRLVMNEIFDEKNFIGQLIWINRTTPNDAGNNFASDHEYILAYARNKPYCKLHGTIKDLSKYRNPDNDPNGPWIPDNPSAASGNTAYRIPIVNPYTGQAYTPPKGRYWAFSPNRVEEWHKSGKLVFPKEQGKNFLLKKYLTELRSELKPFSSVVAGILTAAGTKELKALFDGESPFRFPKPVALIETLIQQATGEEDIILDFFAGSGTTAHAVLQLNAATGSKRRFICVQIPEPNSGKDEILRKKYPFVSDVTKARIAKVQEHLGLLKDKTAKCSYYKLLPKENS